MGPVSVSFGNFILGMREGGGVGEHSSLAVTISLYECLICIHGAALTCNHRPLQIHKKIFKTSQVLKPGEFLIRIPFYVSTLTSPRLSFMSLEIGGSLLLNLISQRMDLETVETGHKLVCRTLWSIFRVHHEQHVGEPGTEV